MLLPSNLLTAATSASVSFPSTVTDGVALPYLCDQATVLVKSTAGSGTMTATVRVWGYFVEAADWYSLGVLNASTAIPETSTDAIAYAEAVVGLRGVTRLAATLDAIAGTSTAVTVKALAVPASTQST